MKQVCVLCTTMEAEYNNRLLIYGFYCISFILHELLPLNLKFGWRQFSEIHNRSFVFSEQKLDHNLEKIMNSWLSKNQFSLGLQDYFCMF